LWHFSSRLLKIVAMDDVSAPFGKRNSVSKLLQTGMSNLVLHFLCRHCPHEGWRGTFSQLWVALNHIRWRDEDFFWCDPFVLLVYGFVSSSCVFSPFLWWTFNFWLLWLLLFHSVCTDISSTQPLCLLNQNATRAQDFSLSLALTIIVSCGCAIGERFFWCLKLQGICLLDGCLWVPAWSLSMAILVSVCALSLVKGH
jgi:hypothetical protein